MYQLTDILIEYGHRRIAILLSNEPQMTSVRERLRGYREALEAHGLVYDERFVCETIYEAFGISSDNLNHLHDSYAGWLGHIHRNGPTAVVAINNYLAEQTNIDLMKIQMELMQAVINDGAQDVDPELNIALASISHKRIALRNTFLVALALQSGETLGEKAMELVVGRIDGTVTGPSKSIVVPMDTVQLEGELSNSSPIFGDARTVHERR